MKLRQELDYPLRGKKLKRNIILSIALSLFQYVIPLIYYIGYILEDIKYTINEKENPPEIKINNFIKYMKNGLISTGITSIYLLPILGYFVILSVSYVFGSGAASHTETSAILVNIGVYGSILITLIHLLISAYLIPISLSLYVKTNSILKSFSPIEIFNIIYNKQYAIYTLIATIIFSINLIIILGTLYISLLFPPLIFIYLIVIPLYLSLIILLTIHIMTIGIRESINS